MIKVGIIGATGYAGGELVRILMGHKDAEIKWYGMQMYTGICSRSWMQSAWMTIWKSWQIR